MDKTNTYNGLLSIAEKLSNANGVPGFEDEAVSLLKQFGKEYGEVSEDRMRNVYIKRKQNDGRRPVILLDAHSDEVGFMVHSILPNGMLQFIPLGSWVTSNVPAHRVRVRNAEGKYIHGIVASKPPHFMTAAEKDHPLELDKLIIDVGATSKKEAIEDFKIRIGEPIVPDAEFNYQPDKDLMNGKAFDCRLGCTSILGTLGALKEETLRTDIVATFSAQEEVGMRGAQITSRKVKADLAIVFEGCPADDTFTEEYEIQTALKKGPMLRHIDTKMITSPRFQRFALSTAAEKGIPVQESVRRNGFTNGFPIHLSNQGVPCIVIGVPVRYAHTHYGISAFSDVQNTVSLAAEIIRALDETTIFNF